MAEAKAQFDGEQHPPGGTLRLLAAGQPVFGRYRLIRILGCGGMGVVWLARDELLSLDVALKFLSDQVNHDQEAIADLRRETRHSLALTHANIVRVYDLVQDSDRGAIVMEYIDGVSLAARKVQRPNPWFEVEEIAPWIQQLCVALHYAHTEAKVVHQDLKPSNLMVTAQGLLKVTDFGIARSLRDSLTRITAEDRSGGTLLYMGPQQLDGARPSTLNDIYSLGATLYDLLTGKPPFYTGALYEQIAHKVPPRLAERRAELERKGQPIPEHWEQTVAACLAKQPERRPQSALEVARRLGLTDSPGITVDLRGLPAPEPARRRTRWVWAAVPLLLGGLYLAVSTPGWLARSRPAHWDAASVPAGTGLHSSVKLPDYFAPQRKLARPSVFAMAPAGRAWENSLGMRFLPMGKVGLSVWETRVQDFEVFVNETHHDASKGVIGQGATGYLSGFSWKAPGFPQGPTHPVCGLNWEDGMAFCRWLTERERQQGRLNVRQSYRLPFIQEWEQAAGPGIYPWGNDWPPPPGTGNFAGVEVREDGHWPAGRPVIEGYNDGFARTSPVGTFRANAQGFFDLSGNVWEWCMDAAGDGQRALCGGSWHNLTPANFRVDWRNSTPAQIARDVGYGFRCVLEEEAAP